MYYLIEQTNACNLRCPCCPNRQHARPTGFMTPQTFRLIVDQILAHDRDARDARIPLHGTGEPLLSPHFWTNLDYAESKGLRNVDFTSNGMLMTRDVVERLGSYRCLSWVRVSLNSARREAHTVMNEGSDFDAVVRNARDFLDVARGFRPVIQLMQTRINEHECPEEVFELFGREVPLIVKRLDTFAGQVDDFGLAYPFEAPAGCCYGNHCLYFHWDGDITGCCFDGTKTQVMGNARDGIFSAAVTNRKARLSAALARRDWAEVPLCGLCHGVEC